MIDLYIIFNKPTDRQEWLERCVKTFAHPDVEVRVHAFTESGNVRERRSRILEQHRARDRSRWITFADPDDWAVRPGYDRYIKHLLQTDDDVCWPWEAIKTIGSPEPPTVSKRPHHLVALRGDWVGPYPPTRRYFSHALAAGNAVEEVAYCWANHPRQTRGWDRVNRVV